MPEDQCDNLNLEGSHMCPDKSITSRESPKCCAQHIETFVFCVAFGRHEMLGLEVRKRV